MTLDVEQHPTQAFRLLCLAVERQRASARTASFCYGRSPLPCDISIATWQDPGWVNLVDSVMSAMCPVSELKPAFALGPRHVGEVPGPEVSPTEVNS
jgi:hypothetical protein